jgi:hypothetical protein
MFASGTNDSREERAAPLVQAERLALRGITKVALSLTLRTGLTARLTTTTQARGPVSIIIMPAPVDGMITVAFTALFQLEDMRGVSLNVTERKFVFVNHVPLSIHTDKLMNARHSKIPNASPSIIVGKIGNTAQPKMMGKETIVIGIAICVNLRLEQGHNIRIVGLGDSLEENASAHASVKIVVFLCLQTKVQVMDLTKFKHIGVPMPKQG